MPASEVREVAETLHGVEIRDPYRWLEDQDAPATRDWIARQNTYTDAILGNRPEPALFAPRLRELLSTDKVSTPMYRAGRYFFKRREVGQDLYSIYMREGATAKDQLLIDPAPLSADHTTNVGVSDVSTDGKVLAYFVRKGGADEYEIHFFDVDARQDIGTPLPLARYYGTTVTPERQVYFTRQNADGPRVYRRALGGGAETEVFGAGYTKEKIIFNTSSDDGRYMLIHVFHGSAPKKTELYLDDLRDNEPARTVVNDLDFRSTGEMAGDFVVIQSNWDAPNDRVFVAPAASPGRANWKEIVPENPKAAIQGTSLAGGRVFVSYLEDVKPRIIGYDLQGDRKEEVSFDTLGNLATMSGTWDSPLAFFSFSSYHMPPTIYQYDVARGERTVFARESAPVVSENFTVEQVWYPSKDGTRIPMFLMYKKGLQRNGKNPTYMTAYGGFTSSMLPNFSASAITWAEQGGIYAVPNLRGGGEFGEGWHRAGMLDKKQNTFDDFIAAAEFLIRERYTSSRNLGISGGSNGGLLVAATAMQRPELVSAVICSFPLIDMIRYHQFLVAGYWVPEYGSSADPEQFRWLYAYSPYHHVKRGTKYPAMLFITGDADTRVAPLHARKMTALMQRDAANGPEDPILLRYHEAFGHSGGEPLNVQVTN
ncbi:MAG TPA: prolyl oligopeptidase family serine peptidase [Thermoanaerobaculia bacterium]|nr:prolyl oligopeptidase family serine peptidase [Thermoanaerobaculia bacterium]